MLSITKSKSRPEEWTKWIRRFERFRKASGLPEVLRVAISEALTSGKKLSWSVWENGEITSVKLL